MERSSLYFTAPQRLEVRREPLPEPKPGQLLVQSLRTAISAGTELLFYRNQLPAGTEVDATIDALEGTVRYPLKYGYAAVGIVVELAPGAEASWRDRLVFAFQPHESHFWSDPQALTPLPEGLNPEEAVFVPNMESAVNFVHDGRPLLGERVLVLGQGIVGLLTTSLLHPFPLAALVTLDRFPLRRQMALEAGADASLDPDDPDTPERLTSALQPPADPPGADLCFELTGAPEALNLALAHTGFGGRIVIGSWYGSKQAPIDLGGSFHRSRIQLISSQVSSLNPLLSARLPKPRRMALAWQMLETVRPSRFITHRFPIEQADEAYRLLDQQPQDAVQVVFTYDS